MDADEEDEDRERARLSYPEGACAPPNLHPLSHHTLTIGGPGGLARTPCFMARTARQHEVQMARNMMSNYTDMQDSIVVTATTFTLFKANTKETTKELARPKPRHLFWGGGRKPPPLYIGFE